MGKKVWIWNHYASDMFKNSGGRHYSFAQILKQRGYDVMIFCANTFHNSTDKIEVENGKYKIIEKDGIPFVFVKTTVAVNNGIDRVMNMGLFFKNILSVAKTIEKSFGKTDIILASSVHPLTMVAGILVGRKFDVPCICEVRDLWPESIFRIGKLEEDSLFGKALKKGEQWIYQNADAIIFTKEGDVDYILEEGWDIPSGGNIDLDKIYYINNGVDLKKFALNIQQNPLNDEQLLNDNFQVTYTGAIRPVNNVKNLVETARILNEKGYDRIELLIYGEGNEKDKLIELANQYKLSNIHFKGNVHKKYIPYILSKSSVNILNYSDTLYNWSRGNSSNKLFEYMASGKPIISTVKMGYSIIDKYNCGMEIEENTPEALADAIIQVYSLDQGNYEEYCLNAKEGAKDFDFNKHVDSLEVVIESVLKA